jgi:hypothetical protein
MFRSCTLVRGRNGAAPKAAPKTETQVKGNNMKRILFAATSVIALSTAAFAAIDINDLDTNGDNGASFEEVTAKAPTLNKLEFDDIDTNDNNIWDANEMTGDAQALLIRYMEGESTTQDDFKLDTDKNEKISLAEVNAVAPSVTQLEFDDIDTNDDNHWDATELNADAQGLLRRDTPSQDSSGPYDITSLDTDGDNAASIEEVMAKHPKISKEEFLEVDADGSNKWDREEIMGSVAQGYLGRT